MRHTILFLVMAAAVVTLVVSLYGLVGAFEKTPASAMRVERRNLDPAFNTTKDHTSNGDDNDASFQMACTYNKDNGGRVTMVSPDQFWKDPHCSLNVQEEVLFMHLGKAGGGTVYTVANDHRVLMGLCHPMAASCKPAQAKRILINLRDPVDRFVSAFNWRALVLCGEDDSVDDRIPAYNEAAQDPIRFCKEPGYALEIKEAKIIHNAYHYNVNEFAESLCLEGPKGDEARKHASMMQHLRDPIINWVEDFLSPQPQEEFPKLREIVAMVLEDKDYPFKETVSHALRYVIGQEYPSSYLKGWGNNGPDTTTPSSGNNQLEKENMHSTKSHHVFPGGIEMATITELGSCCIARHLQKDYQVLRALAGMEKGSQWEGMDARLRKACHWGTEEDTQRCIQSIKSMVQRRESYLVNMETTSCQDALAG